MHKLIALLSNHPSPLEKELFNGTKTIEFFVQDPHDFEEVLRVLEPLVMEIRDEDTTALALRVNTESGSMVLNGTIKEGFNGIVVL